MMKKIKTAELTGAALDRAVAECEGRQVFDSKDALRNHLNSLDQDELWNALCANTPADIDASISSVQEMITYGVDNWRYPAYSTDWARGGPIVDRELSKLFKNVGGTFSAQIRHEEPHPLVSHPVLAGWTNAAGPTLLIAAMRCYVAAKLGNEVEVPEELPS